MKPPGLSAVSRIPPSWALFALPALMLAWTVHDIVATYSAVPFNDQWANIWWWREILKNGLTWSYLFSQHNEHRILFPRLVFLADLKWFQGRDILNLVVIGLIQLGAAAFYLTAADLRRLRPLGVLGAATAVGMMVSLLQWENFFWGFQVQFVGVYAAGAWAIYLFCVASEESGGVRWPTLLGALAVLTLATFNMANGVFAGIAMVLVSVVTRRGLKAALIAAVATAVLTAIYLHGYQPVAFHSPPSLAIQHPGRYLSYVAAYIGNTWAQDSVIRAQVMGLVGVALTAAMVVAVYRDGGRHPGRAALLGVVLFIGMSAAATSLGRLIFGVEQALSSRYVTPTSHFWAAQALFWALTAQDSRSIARKLAVGAAVGLAFIMLIPLQKLGRDQVLGTRERIELGASVLLSSAPDEAAMKQIYPEASMVEDLAPFLREQRLSVFADDPGYVVGAPFALKVTAPEERVCRGAFDRLNPEPQGGAGWRADGWGWDRKRRSIFHHIVLVDDTGHVVGVAGPGGTPRGDVRKAVRQVRTLDSGWVASAIRGSGREVVAYGLTRDGRACELGRKAWPQ
ncbi:hypothetical protein [Phenylobacterium hankyongense]|uniref:hypothetical protein n=1 Tax=Phenylobacterium hankyongense TaxID=1813876 RepID=UPI0014025BE7|nr:hypothetical protein [Phenylobacterium hankyongense]